MDEGLTQGEQMSTDQSSTGPSDATQSGQNSLGSNPSPFPIQLSSGYAPQLNHPPVPSNPAFFPNAPFYPYPPGVGYGQYASHAQGYHPSSFPPGSNHSNANFPA